MPGKYCALVEASVLDNLGKRYPGKPSRQTFGHCPHKANPPPEYSVHFFCNNHHLHSLLPLILGVVVHHAPDQHNLLQAENLTWVLLVCSCHFSGQKLMSGQEPGDWEVCVGVLIPDTVVSTGGNCFKRWQVHCSHVPGGGGR